jgi:hypothetical protein
MASRPAYDTRTHGPTSISESVEIVRPALQGLDARLDLPSGRTIECADAEAGGELVTIRSPNGTVELEVRLTDRGPVLRFEAASLDLEAAGRIRTRCKSFEVVAEDAAITATRGDVQLRANDDVRLNGERVKLNCS